MKNSLIFTLGLLFLIILSLPTTAQTCFDKGTITLNPGFAVGYSGYYRSPSSNSFPIIVSAEYGFTDLISGGLFASQSVFRFVGYNSSYTTIGVRGSFHFNTLLEKWTGGDWKVDKFDLYASALTGFEIANFKVNDNGALPLSPNSSRPVYGIIVGARWYFIPNIGVFAEVGRGSLGVLTAGLTIKI